MNSRLTSAIGFAMKAGKLVSGDFTVEKAIRARRAKIGLIDSAASENTREKYRAMCGHAGISLIEIDELGRWIGKPGRMLAAVTDGQFTAMIQRAFDEEARG